MEKKTDLRVVKTKKLLYESLSKLLREKSFEQIKISDICNEALINRSTFYAHYNDKYELLNDLFENLRTKYLSTFKEFDSIEFSKEYIIKNISILIDFLDEKPEIHTEVFIKNKDGVLITALTNFIETNMKERFSNNKSGNLNGVPLDVLVCIFSGALVNLGVERVNKTINYSKEEILHYLDLIIPDDK